MGNYIFLADDDENITNLLKFTLEKNGYRTDVVNDGGKVIGFLKGAEPKPELIIMDLMMPGMGGYEVIRELQSDASIGSIPVVIITGRELDNSTKSLICSEPNVRDFITKPIKMEHLLNKVREILAKPA